MLSKGTVDGCCRGFMSQPVSLAVIVVAAHQAFAYTTASSVHL